MAEAVVLPEHKLSETPNSRAIDIFDWTVTAETGPISSATHCDSLHAALGIPLPEMTFGSNLLRITHRPTGWTYTFRAEDALREVKNGPLEAGDGGVKVGYADAWLKSRCAFRLGCACPPQPKKLRAARATLTFLFLFSPTCTTLLLAQDWRGLADSPATDGRHKAVRLDVYDDLRRKHRRPWPWKCTVDPGGTHRLAARDPHR